jgi:hypothetical protein
LTVGTWYSEAKLAIEGWTGLDKDALHIHAAILLYLFITLVLRRPGLWAWLAVLAVELANEALDLREQYQAGILMRWTEAAELGWPAAVKDIWNTMVWPTALLLVGRYVVRRSAEPGAVFAPPPAEANLESEIPAHERRSVDHDLEVGGPVPVGVAIDDEGA